MMRAFVDMPRVDADIAALFRRHMPRAAAAAA